MDMYKKGFVLVVSLVLLSSFVLPMDLFVVADASVDYEFGGGIEDHESDERDNFYFTDEDLDYAKLRDEGHLNETVHGVDVYMEKDPFYLEVEELDNKNMRVIFRIHRDYMELLNVGVGETEDHEKSVMWGVISNTNVFSFDLDARAYDVFELNILDMAVNERSYSIRSSRHSESVEVSLNGDESVVAIRVDEEIGDGNDIELRPDDFMVKVRVDGGYWYGITDDRGGDYYYDVEGPFDGEYRIVIWFNTAGSGDVKVISNPLWIDYVTLNPILEVMGRHREPSASGGI